MREFGIYPETSVPLYWIGCRAVITKWEFDVPWDRWSSEFHITSRKEEFIEWVNNSAIEELESRVNKHDIRGYFDSENGKWRCEYNDRHSGGYLYCGFYNTTIEAEDEKEIEE